MSCAVGSSCQPIEAKRARSSVRPLAKIAACDEPGLERVDEAPRRGVVEGVADGAVEAAHGGRRALCLDSREVYCEPQSECAAPTQKPARDARRLSATRGVQHKARAAVRGELPAENADAVG